jgi:hypothetical protein
VFVVLACLASGGRPYPAALTPPVWMFPLLGGYCDRAVSEPNDDANHIEIWL